MFPTQFNGIDCSPTNPDVCCVVGDGDPGQCVNNPGAWVVCTFDGGKTWNEQYSVLGNATLDYSFMELRFSSATEAWAIGGLANAGTTVSGVDPQLLVMSPTMMAMLMPIIMMMDEDG